MIVASTFMITVSMLMQMVGMINDVGDHVEDNRGCGHTCGGMLLIQTRKLVITVSLFIEMVGMIIMLVIMLKAGVLANLMRVCMLMNMVSMPSIMMNMFQ
jgi:hypothetical protein